MKNIKKRWLGLAIAPALLALIGFASPALANDYTGTCAAYPGSFDGTGNVDINSTGVCTISVPVTAQGFVHITSTGAITAQGLTAGTDIDVKTTTAGAITTQSLSSASGDIKLSSKTNITITGTIGSNRSIQANATNGKITISGNSTSNLSGTGGNVLLVATGNVLTGSISTNGGTTTGSVEIRANTNAAGVLFKIGTATNNGVTGTINTSNTTGGGTSPYGVLSGGIFITNGNATSTAGINVTSASSINVTASASRSGLIILDARKGILTLPTGALSSAGPAGQPAGQIVLMAGTLKTVNNTVITASQTAAALSTFHGVFVAASSITVAGAGGLKINGDGNGIIGWSGSANAAIIPTGAVTVTSTAFVNNDVNNMVWTTSAVTTALTNAPVTVSGTGALTVTANGDYAVATVLAYPITFSNGAVSLTSKGNIDHRVDLGYGGSLTGVTGLTFNGTGVVTLDASGLATGNTGGTARIFADKAVVSNTVPSFNMFANAPSGGGNAGIVSFSTSALTLNTVTKAKITSNGPTAGTGNGGNITFFPGTIADLKLGTNAGNVQVLANGGSTGGDAGSLNINPFPSPSNVTIDTANAVSAMALGGNAKGGFVQLVANPNLSVNPTLSGATINVDGKGTGKAGEIHIFANGTLNLGSAAGSLLLSAKGDPAGTGDGGIVELGYITNLTQAGILSVNGGAASGSNAKGGTINFHDINALSATGTITANGKGTGFPGTINLAQTFGANNMNLAGANISASGDPAGDASGHDIDISSSAGINMSGTVLHADAGGTGNAFGGSVHITSAAQVDLTQPNILITAKGADNGPGGVVVISSVSNFDVHKVINVDGGGSIGFTIFDGSVQLNSKTCTQKRIDTTWPKSYWNCTSTNLQDSLDAIPSSVAQGLVNLTTQLSTAKTQLYVFNNAADYNAFWNDAIEAVAGGSTYSTLLVSGDPTEGIYVNVFQNGNIEDNISHAYDASQITSVAAHEFGHAVDISFSLLSLGATYNTYLVRDLQNLDFVLDTTIVPNVLVRRRPCESTPLNVGVSSDTPPFQGAIIMALPGTPSVCSGNVLNPVAFPVSPTSNSYVIRQVSGSTFGGPPPPHWTEAEAHTFAFRAVGSGGRPAVDAVMSNTAPSLSLTGGKYFGCLKSWADAQIAGNSSLGVAIDSCGVLDPSYTPFVP